MAFEVTADPAALAYATIDQADEAAETRVGGAAWSALDDETKDKHLITASLDIDTVDFIGERASTTQELEWPRTDTDYSDDAWPMRLVEAVIALAWSNAAKIAADAAADVLDTAVSDVKREKTGPLETEWFDRGKPAATALDHFPNVVQRLLAPLVRAAAVPGWGSATVSRAS